MAGAGSTDFYSPTPIGLVDSSEPTPNAATGYAHWRFDAEVDGYVTFDLLQSTYADGGQDAAGPIAVFDSDMYELLDADGSFTPTPWTYVTGTDYVNTDHQQRVGGVVQSGHAYLIRAQGVSDLTSFGSMNLVLRVSNYSEPGEWQDRAEFSKVLHSTSTGYNRSNPDITIQESQFASDTGVLSTGTFGFNGYFWSSMPMGTSTSNDGGLMSCAWNYARRAYRSLDAQYWRDGCPTPPVVESRGVAYRAGWIGGARNTSTACDLTYQTYAAQQVLHLHNIETTMLSLAPAATSDYGTGIEYETDGSCRITKVEVSPDEKSNGGSYASGVTVDWYAAVNKTTTDNANAWGPARATYVGNASGPESFTSSHTKVASYSGGLSPWAEVAFQDAYGYETAHASTSFYDGGLVLAGIPTMLLSASPPGLTDNVTTNQYRDSQFCALRITAKPARYRVYPIPDLDAPPNLGGPVASRRRFWGTL